MAVMLLQTFLLFQEVVSKSLESCVEFMKVMVPTFCLSMMFASNVSSAAGFYQTAFLVIYLVEWLFLNLLMPLIHLCAVGNVRSFCAGGALFKSDGTVF